MFTIPERRMVLGTSANAESPRRKRFRDGVAKKPVGIPGATDAIDFPGARSDDCEDAGGRCTYPFPVESAKADDDDDHDDHDVRSPFRHYAGGPVSRANASLRFAEKRRGDGRAVDRSEQGGGGQDRKQTETRSARPDDERARRLVTRRLTTRRRRRLARPGTALAGDNENATGERRRFFFAKIGGR